MIRAGVQNGQLSNLVGGPDHQSAQETDIGIRCWGTFDYGSNNWVTNDGEQENHIDRLVTGTNDENTYANIDHLATDHATSCFVHGGNNIACFGGNEFGVHDPTVNSSGWQSVRTVHPELRGQVSALAMHSGTACMVMDGQVYCWGNGANDRTASSHPTAFFEAAPQE